jgi:hypothetical protein
MRSATAIRWTVWGLSAVLSAGLGACKDNALPVDSRDAAAVDTGSHPTDVAAEVKADVPIDRGQDLPPTDVVVVNPLCQGVPPTANTSDPYVVANFDNANDSTFSPFGSGEPISGGTYTSGGVQQDFSGQNWRLAGTVASGDEHFGIYWTCSLPTAGGGCTLDTSRFRGMRFTVKGNVGPDHAMSFSLGRAENDPSVANAGCGSCTVPATSDAAVGDYCRGPRVMYNVPDDGQPHTITVLWTDFTDGSPHASIDPHQLTGMLWIFHPPATTDGGASDAGDAGSDGPMSMPDADATDAPASTTDGATDAPASTGDAATDAGDNDAGASDALPPGQGYSVDITVDDIQLVPY